MLAMLLAVLPQAGMAETISAGEALFGDAGYTEAAAAADDELNDDMYGSNDTASASDYPTLRLGDSDSADGVAYIVFMQNRLIELGYLADEADGYYGDNTQQAIKEFQKSNGLQETGIADPSTQAKLYSDVSTLVRASADSTLFGSDVMRTQSAMVQWGFMFSKVDGKMGNNTRTAIKNFKKYMAIVDPTYGATPTPIPTATPVTNINSTFGDMPAALDVLLEGANPLTITADGEIDEALLSYVDGDKKFQVYRQTVRNGDSGDEVFRVQRRLKNLKYLYSADGNFGNLTEVALKYFQKKHGLTESGVADERTQKALFSSNAMPSEEYVFPYKIVVDVSDQRVYVGQWDGSAYSKLVKKFKCSSGKKGTPTPLGTYQCYGRAGGRWYYFKDFNCYAQWATRIVGGILFHSVTYNSRKRPSGSERDLGRRASHGCIRLRVVDAKWIYDHIARGTTVVIRN